MKQLIWDGVTLYATIQAAVILLFWLFCYLRYKRTVKIELEKTEKCRIKYSMMELTNEELILLIKCTHLMSAHTPVKESRYQDVNLISHKLEQEYKKRNYGKNDNSNAKKD